MRILACRNFCIMYPHAHFERFSTTLGLSAALDQFLRKSLVQARAHVAAGHDARVIKVPGRMALLRATVSMVGHLIADRMGLQRAEIFSSVHMQSHTIRPSPEGAG
jgi:hypothetical protein